MLRRNADAGVFDDEPDEFVEGLGIDSDTSAGRGEFHCIGEEIGKYVADARRVGQHGRRLHRHIHVESQSLVVKSAFQRRDSIGYQAFGGLCLEIEPYASGFEAAHVEKVLDNFLQAVGIVTSGHEQFGLFRV